LNNEKKISNKEKELIRKFKSGDKTAINEIQFLIKPITKTFARGDAEKEKDLCQGILTKIWKFIKENEIKENFQGWIKTVARNYCINEYKKNHKEKRDFNIDLSIVKSDEADIPGSKEYHEKSEKIIIANYIKKIPDDIKKGIDLSLNYIEELYAFKERIKSLKDPIPKILDTLENAKKDIRFYLGKNFGGKIENKIARYNYLMSGGLKKEEIGNKEIGRECEILMHQSCSWLFLEEINKLISQAKVEFRTSIIPYPYEENLFNLIMPITIEELYKVISRLQIEPPRLMFAIWSKAPELKSGSQKGLKKLKLIFAYLKITTRRTKREHLFDPVKGDLSNFESIRKSQYKKIKNKRFINRFIKYVYFRSFVQKVGLKDPLLSLMYGKENGLPEHRDSLLATIESLGLKESDIKRWSLESHVSIKAL